LLDI